MRKVMSIEIRKFAPCDSVRDSPKEKVLSFFLSSYSSFSVVNAFRFNWTTEEDEEEEMKEGDVKKSAEVEFQNVAGNQRCLVRSKFLR